MPTEKLSSAPAAEAAAPVAAAIAPQSVVRQAARVAWKDLRVELRSREIVYTVGFFAALVVVVFSFAFPSAEPRVIAQVAPGMIWVAIAFAGTIGLSRAFDREREGDTMRALLLAPAPRLAVFLGKAIAIAVLIMIVEAIIVPLTALLLGAHLFGDPAPLALALTLGALGFAVAGSVFAAALLRVRARDVLLPVVLYPILIPLFVAGTHATAALLEVPADLDKAWYWITFLAVFDAAFLVVSMWVFEALVIE
ncbi:MAG: heme exporter protein CcmB [Burkholderiales bacterium]|nr:heme exporter protein CcmB [Burkholderiales bacterium]